MPDITLAPIDPRLALASVVASIALQEAAVSHVLNAEGEKIQAVVGLPGTTVGDLQDINLSVGGTVDSVALLEDVLQNKLRTALGALYPTATFTISFIDSVTGDPVDCQCVLCTLTNLGTGEETTVHAIGDALILSNLKPGSYTLEMIGACAGYEINGTVFDIEVDAQGNATFDGVPVDETPPVIELTEDPFGGRAAPAAAQAAAAASIVTVQENVPEAAAQEAAPEPNAALAADQYIVSTLTNRATGDISAFYPDGDTLILPHLEPGSYTLNVTDVYAGYARSVNAFEINVCAAGRVRCNGVVVTDETPATAKLTEEEYLVLRFE